MVGFGRVNLLKVMEIIRPDLSINITSISSNNIQIFPNPFSDAIQITTMHPMENCTITLTSSLGQVIRQFDPVLVKNFNLDLGYLPVGVYFITFENKNEKVVSKIVKQ